jgi:hypothetical protein
VQLVPHVVKFTYLPVFMHPPPFLRSSWELAGSPWGGLGANCVTLGAPLELTVSRFGLARPPLGCLGFSPPNTQSQCSYSKFI